jgi:alkylated DNA repair dioxygenase AlkB
MPDLFSHFSANRPEIVALAEAEVSFQENFLNGTVADDLYRLFMRDIQWAHQKVFVWGKWHMQPRLTAWYGDPGASYSYSGNNLDPKAWTPALAGLRDQVQSAVGVSFNSVLLNRYRDENDRVGWHSDNEPELGVRPTIASISLGETRQLLFKRREKGRRGNHAIPLTHGSLLVMKGDTQKYWLHAIERERSPCGARINLTFRTIHRRKPS